MLRAALIAAGLNVVVVAPSANQSGISRAATYKNPIRAALIESEGGKVYSVAGTPVDCVRIALGGGLVADADLVISGINHGANVGDDIYNSGTVGAAVEAALFDVAAMAVSQQSLVDHFNILDPVGVPTVGFEQSARYGVAVARALLDKSAATRTVVNVNVPAVVPSGIAVTRLGKRFYQRNSLEPLGEHGPSTYYLVYGSSEGQAAPFETAGGTDFAALQEGLVSVSPVDYEHGLDASFELADWAQGLVGRAEEHLAL
ncbi:MULTISPECIES: 5'/3'-nucleotidase SurE [Nocardia]|uniref:5'-nucleotidase n=1 Tax=Nocardia vinacea TaxID=96468 RepID=A0ABZ1YLT9_9NOCA|nr:5'/3'-nucleotidase SurE [Nocardia vinacea]